MNTYQQGDALLAAVSAAPYDAPSRLVYADWLEEQGEAADAALQRWVAAILTGEARFDLVVRRGGLHVPASLQAPTVPTQTRNLWTRVAAGLFEQQPDLALVIVSSQAMTEWGLRSDPQASADGQHAPRSPVLYYRRNWKAWGGPKNKRFPRVVPAAILPRRRRRSGG